MIKYSFLVPVYNVESFLRECLDSLANQDFRENEYEVLITDDGSTDDSSRICDEYIDEFTNFRVIHQKNSGLLQARKTGVINARGEYLLFVDSDDYVAPDLLRTVDQYLDDKIECLIYGLCKVYKGKIIRHRVTEAVCEQISKEEMLKKFASSFRYNAIFCKVVRRSFLMEHINEMYPDKYINFGEDRLQTAYLLKYVRNVQLIKDTPYYYRIRNDSIIRRASLFNVKQKKQTSEMIKEVLIEALDSANITTKEKEALIDHNDALNLNDLLDAIYKYNTDKGTHKKTKYKELKKVIEDGGIDFLQGDKILYQVKGYNRCRYYMLKTGRFQQLIFVDGIIKKIQMVVELLLGRQSIVR